MFSIDVSPFPVLTEESSLGDESPQDLLSIVPLDSMDESFVHYITNSNNEILMEQIDALKKVIQFIKNPNLIEERQAEVRDHYLEKWKIPKEARKNKPKQVRLLLFVGGLQLLYNDFVMRIKLFHINCHKRPFYTF